MLKIWKRSPMLRLVPAYTAGILIELSFSVPITLVIIGACVSLLLFLYFHYVKNVVLFSQRHISGIAGYMLVFALGVICTHYIHPHNSEIHYSHLYKEGDALIVRVIQDPIEKEKSFKTKAQVIGVKNQFDITPSAGLIMVYLKKDSLSNQLKVDDVLLIASNPTAISGPQNPLEFDYKKYLSYHFIFDQVYADNSKWKLLRRPDNHTIIGLFVTWREYLLDKMRQEVDDEETIAVLAALILGKTDEIGFELMSSYSSAGAIHVLAVSGLHVGLVYLMLNKLMDLFFQKKKQKLLRTILPIVILWLYSGVTGLSPSVLRSALMFTCFIISANWNKNSNIFNTMSFSAMLLLVINPYNLMEVGFQLSYLAVLGIVVLQKKICALIYIKNKWLYKVWELTAVSLAAQIVTFPLSLFYFHQFPNYFLFSNLIVIPLSTWILYCCIVYFMVCWIPYVSDFLIYIGAIMTGWMNAIVRWFDQLPFSIIEGVSISVLECYILFAILFFICRWMFWQKTRALPIALGCSLVLAILQVTEKTNILKQNELCIHSIGGYECITQTFGETAFVSYNKGLINNESKVRFHLKNYWDNLGVKTIYYIATDSLTNFYKPGFKYQYPYLQAGENRLLTLTDISVHLIEQNQKTLLVAGEEVKSHYWKKEELELLKGNKILFTHALSASKKEWIKKHIPPSTYTYDLKQGAYIMSADSMMDFRHFY